MANSVNNCVVALLGRDDGARHQLRTALEELGAEVAYESEPSSATDASILGVSATVLVINLEDGADDEIDHLHSVFEDPSINVIFNDADVSKKLEGWDLARWARHLASKVLGHENTMPPLPEGANVLYSSAAAITPEAAKGPKADESTVVFSEIGDTLAAAVDSSEPVTVLSEAVDLAWRQDDAVALMTDEHSHAQHEDFVAPIKDSVVEFASEDLAAFTAGESLSFAADEIAFDKAEFIAPEKDTFVEFSAESKLEFAADEILELDFSSLDSAMGLSDAPAPERLSTTPEPVDQVLIQNLALEDTGIASAMTHEAAIEMASIEEQSFGIDATTVANGLPSDEFEWDFDDIKASPKQADNAATSDGDFSLGSIEMSLDSANETASSEESASDTLSWMSQEDNPSSGNRPLNTSWSVEAMEDSISESAEDESFAALAAQFDAMEAATASVGEAASAGLDFAHLTLDPAQDSTDDVSLDALAPSSEQVSHPAVDAPTDEKNKSVSSVFSGLSLAPIGEDEVVAEMVESPVKKVFDFSGISGLSLEPLEGEDVAGSTPDKSQLESHVDAHFNDAVTEVSTADMSAAMDEIDPLLVAMGLVEGTAATPEVDLVADDGLQRVIVLGASIGGPDALRSFLSELPNDFPAVFLVVQHLESGYFERLAQQLQKSSALAVKVMADGAQCVQGEVLVVPASHRVSITAQGNVSFAPHQGMQQYTPSIDAVLMDVANTFRSKATAIIFSGMAGDAVEGAVHLTNCGGEVWAQDPQSCVVSSMVDGARARGVVEFTGSPRELALHCISRFGGKEV